MDAILADPHFDAGIEIYVLMNMIVPMLDYAGEVWQGNTKFAEQLETIQITAAKKNTKMLKYDE